MEIKTLSDGFFLEKLNSKKDVLDLNTILNLPTKYVCFIPSQNRLTRDVFSEYVKYNYDYIEGRLKELGYQFFILDSEFLSHKVQIYRLYKQYVYNFPYLDNPALDFFGWLNDSNNFYLGDTSIIHRYYGSTRDWDSGFFWQNDSQLSFFPTSYTDLHPDKNSYSENHNKLNFTNQEIDAASSLYLAFLDSQEDLNNEVKELYCDESVYDYSPIESFEPETRITLDEETQQIIKEIEQNLEQLKRSGNFIFVAPLLEQFLNDYNVYDSIHDPPYKLYISPFDFRITIPDLNVEIKMNALTKAVYFLFLSCNKGIDLNRLYLYEDYLMKIYLAVSNKTDINAMRKSVNAVVNPNNDLIYMHLSRIKSAFRKQFNDSIASFYYVHGQKGGEKYISLDSRCDSNIDKLETIWGKCPDFG